MEHRATAEQRDHYEGMFRSIISTSEMRSLDDASDREGLRRDVRRIASTLFCSNDIDPSIVTFAKRRAALHWGLPEGDVDVMVTARLLQKAASLIRDLHWLGAVQAVRDGA